MSNLMSYAQYLRIETKAGGVSATRREFIAAAHSRTSREGKGRNMRELRHRWLREGLAYHQQSIVEFIQVQQGIMSYGY
jgi:hypothetical protein